MSAPYEAPPTGAPPEPVCQRCGRDVDPAAIGAQVGLCHCLVCEVYACRRCWIDAEGRCPGCGVRYAVAEAAGVAAGVSAATGVSAAAGGVAVASRVDAAEWSVAADGQPATTGRRPDLRAPLAIGTLVLALALLALAVGGPFGSMAGSDNQSAPPSSFAIASPGSVAFDPSSSGPSGAAEESADPSTIPGSTTPDPTDADVTGPGPASPDVPTAAPTATPTNTPRPTRTPTPTPPPAPTPGPTPACKTVPNLIGSTFAAARATWTAAGFSGSFTPTNGLNTKAVLTQDQTAGACLPASTAITVTYTKAP